MNNKTFLTENIKQEGFKICTESKGDKFFQTNYCFITDPVKKVYINDANGYKSS